MKVNKRARANIKTADKRNKRPPERKRERARKKKEKENLKSTNKVRNQCTNENPKYVIIPRS